MSVSAYPLQWPAMRPRRPRYQVVFSRFDRERSIAQAREFLLNELERLGAKGIVISSNIQLRNDGLPRSGQPQPSDPAVAVWFTLKGQPTCLSCDAWNRVQCNMWAIALYVEATRAQLRNGVATAQEAFTGFKALPPGDEVPHWRRVLGLPDTGTVSRSQIADAYREKAKSAHPDCGGTHEDMAALNAARDTAMAQVTA